MPVYMGPCKDPYEAVRRWLMRAPANQRTWTFYQQRVDHVRRLDATPLEVVNGFLSDQRISFDPPPPQRTIGGGRPRARRLGDAMPHVQKGRAAPQRRR